MSDTDAIAGAEITPQAAYESMAGLVHDLGNYIQIAMSAVRLSSRHEDATGSAALRTMLAQADDALNRAGALVRHTVRGATADEDEDVNIAECVLQMASLLRYATGPHVQVHLLTGLLPRARISRIGLQNALLNLAVNARDAMPGGGALSISAMLAAGPAQPEIEIVVSDDGVGMPADVARRAFEPRFSTKPTGGGMGLPGVQHFVEQAGGRIFMESAPGSGTTVRLRLPAA